MRSLPTVCELLSQRNYQALCGAFSAEMRSALPLGRFMQVWETVVRDAGALRSWKLDQSRAVAGILVEEGTLSFERGSMRLAVSFDGDSLAGFRLAPS